MKKIIYSLSFVFVFVTSHVSAQEEHEIDQIFSQWTLNNVVQTANISTRYYEETSVQQAVDSAYMVFQGSINASIEAGVTLSQSEIDTQVQTFLASLGAMVDDIPKGPKNKPLPEKVINGPCVNMDFEAGNTAGWTLTTGVVDGSVPYSFVAPIVGVGPGVNHQIFGGGVDPVVGIPRVCPGGSFSVRLGNGTTTGATAARMVQTFLVDPTNMYFTYNYAVVFQSPSGHLLNEQPYFTARVILANGTSVTCGDYAVIADAASAPSYQSIVVGGVTILYKNWTSVFTNLSAYVGQNVTVEFTSGDCSKGGHYGYAYVDASCAIQAITATPGTICPGQNTTLTAPGGVGSYLWSNGATTQSTTVNAGGIYTCILTPPQGPACAATMSVNVSVYPQPVANFTIGNNNTCLGTPTTFANTSTIPAPGVIATYQWNFGDGINSPASSGAIVGVTATTGTYTAPSHTYAAVGTYNVVLTVVSADGCSSTITFPVTIKPLPTAIFTKVNVLCSGASTGSIDLTPAGGTAPYTYLWSNGATTQDVSGLAAGVYSVVTTDASGCTVTTSVTITQPAAAVSLSQTHVNVLCFGASTGTINLTVAGGTAPYTYSWSNGAVTEDLLGLAAGTYTVTVTDANGVVGNCTATLPVTITQPAAALTLSATQVNVLCFGNSTGSIDLTPAGGTAPYTYAWSTGAITQDISGLAAGTYTVTVHDANGVAGGCSATLSVTITQPAAALSLSQTHINILCNGGNTGSIDLTPAGGTAPYSYSWSNGAITQDLAALVAGTYTVTVTDAGGCTATLPVTITQPAAALTLSLTQVNVLCNGGLTGSINLTVAGGTAPYTYLWSNGAVTEDLSLLAAGTYTVTVTDANGGAGGCAATISATITQPAAALTLAQTHVNVLCFGLNTGSIDLTPAGGTAPYTYSWSNGAITQDISGLVAGTYTVTVHDANGLAGGCAATVSVTITQPAAALTLSQTHVNVLCNGGITGSIDLTVAGGTVPYVYAWSNGAVTQDLAGLAAGSYTVNVTDGGGCPATTTVVITQPAAPVTVSTTQVNVLCNGGLTGAINLTVAGGTAPYTYAWSNGAITEDINGLAAGTYTVVVTDANGITLGCTATTSVTITQPAAAISLAQTHVNVLCFGLNTGSIDLTPAGGTAPYTYSWSNGAITQDLAGLVAGSYTVTVSDANGAGGGCSATLTVTITQPAAALALSQTHVNVLCNGGVTGSIDLSVAGGTAPYAYSWTNGAITQDLAGIAAGSYTVIVTDANGCTATTTVVITQPAAPVTVSTTQVNVLCNGGLTGSVNLTVAGGTMPYTYAWSNGATTEDLIGLAAGTYTVVVTDANGNTLGCTATTSVTITQPAAALSVSTTQTNVVCFGGVTGAINLTVLGGTAPYTYSWNNGAITEDLAGLAAGTYTVVVSDANGNVGGCTASTTVTITQPAAAVSLSTVAVNVLCNGGLTGSINLTVAGGTAPYTYSWNNGAITEDLAGLAAGTYTVTVHDANGNAGGCASITSVTITQPVAPLSVSATQVNVLCNGGLTGSINLTAVGGTLPYTYSWSNGAVTEDISGLAAGVYTVNVHDANGLAGGCAATTTLTITQPAAPLTVSFTQTNVLCNGNLTGAIDLTPAGGTAPYAYSWNNGAFTQDLFGLAAGAYTVVVTDANGNTLGCTATTTVTITQPTALTQSVTATTFPSGTNISCFGLSDGNVNLTVGGGNPGYTYTWSNGAITQDLTNVPFGIYNVTVTDLNGCTIPSTITLTQPTALTSVVVPSIYVGGFNLTGCANDGSINLTPAGGNPAYTYAWSNGAITQDVSLLAAGAYTVIVTDINGCTSVSNVTLIAPPPLTQSITAFTYPSGTNISCFGLSDGSIDLTIGGGTPIYSYLWSNGATTQDLANVPAGIYTVTATDANGCTINSTITLTEPAALTGALVPSVYAGGFNVSGCVSDGTIDLTPAGGNPGYTYVWSNGAVTQDINSLFAGLYSVVITDINGCQFIPNITLTQPSGLTQSITTTTFPSGTNISCFGLSDGNIDLTVGGGTPGYTYLWNTGAVTQDLTNVPAGAYSVTITDANGCQISSAVNLTEPPALTQTITSSLYLSGTNISCFGANDGFVDLTINGGNPGYTYSWSNGALTQDLIAMGPGVYNVTVTDLNGCSIFSTMTLVEPPLLTSALVPSLFAGGFNISGCVADGTIDLTVAGGNPGYLYAWTNGSAVQDLSALSAGLYSVTVTDVNGCTTTSSITLTAPAGLTQSISATIYPSGTNISCFGLSDGNVDLTITGGVAPLTYAWSNGAVTQDLTNVPFGVYNVTVTDQNGCQISSSITLTQPTALSQAVSATIYPSGTNISCFGLSDGNINLAVAGGNPAYSYLWSNGAITEDLINIPAGVYSVVVTDVNGCTIPSSITITQPALLTSNVVPSLFAGGFNISGCLPDGSINLTVGGGNPGYIYNWSNGSNNEDLSALTAGLYTVTVTDLNGCTTTSSVTLTAPAGLTQAISATVYPSGTNISCFGLSDGNIDLTITGGVAPLTYLWSNGAVTQDLTNVPAGIYNVTVTDQNGCQILSSITLVQPPAMTQAVTSPTFASGTNISCFGANDGSVDLTITGGNPAYIFAWSNGAVTEDFAAMGPGTFTVLVTDLNGCSIGTTITLTEPPLLTSGLVPSLFAGGFNISGCLPDGTIDLTVAGGNPGYVYNWTNGAVIQDLTGLTAGAYSVTVTDVNGCTTTSNIVLTAPAGLTQAISAFVYPSGTNISCFGLNDGSIDLTITGGVAPLSYLWNTGATTEDLTNLIAGTYNVTVTDQNGCQILSSITLVEPPALTQAVTSPTFASGTNISCFGANDGSVDLTITGGNPAYNFAWSNGAITEDLAAMGPGTFTVLVTDVNGCTIPSTITLIEPTLLTSGLVPSVYSGGFNLSGCLPDGTIDLTVAGGNPGYTYAWTNGAVVEDLNTLPAGPYSVTVTDINGCTTTSAIILTQPPGLTQAISAFVYPSGTNISCIGLSDGSVDLTITGGVPGYTYLWNTGAITEDLVNVTAGTYTVVATDQNGCTIASAITLIEPTALTQGVTSFVYPSGSNISCFGLSDGSVDLTIGGGNPGYSYLWSNGAIVQDLAGVAAGTYSVLVTDINGCTIPSSITLVEPPILTQSISAFTYLSGTNISCIGLSDGSIDLTIGGGSPIYTYVWSNGDVVDDPFALPAGLYNVTATDINGCQITSSITLIEPTAIVSTSVLSVYAGGYNVSGCVDDGTIDLTVNGGNPGYTYVWSNGQTTEDLASLPSGFFQVTVTDINGCIDVYDTTLTLAPPIVTLTSVTTNYNGQDITCFGASDGGITVVANGGAPAYAYQWTNSAGAVVGATQSQGGLPSGTYLVTVTDLNGCSATDIVTLVDPTPFMFITSVSTNYNGEDISCFGAADGGINLTVAGATPAYTYAWTSGGAPVSALEDPNGLIVGTYDVLVTDLNGCFFNTSITLTEPIKLTGITSVTSDYNGQDVSCFASSDGSVTVVPSGGTPVYSYIWTDTGGTGLGATQSISGVSAGLYNVQIMDVNGCIYNTDVTVTQPSPVTSNTTIISNYFGAAVSCPGATDGIVSATGFGGTPGYTYSWNCVPVQNTQQANFLGEGSYNVTVTDANGCQSISTVVLTANPAPAFNLPPTVYGCSGEPISINSLAEPGSSCTWTFSDGQVINDCGPVYVSFPPQPACYDMQLQVISPAGCISDTSMTSFACVVPNPIASFYADDYEISSVVSSTNFTNTSVGAVTYFWDFGDSSLTVSTVNAFHQYPPADDFNVTNYNVTLYAISTYGCIDSTDRTITIKPDLIFYVPNAFTPDDDDFNQTFIPVFSSGFSTKNYSFMIFNRWGELIFETHDVPTGWDGTYLGNEVQDGVFTWKIIVETSAENERKTYVGHVTLIR